MPSINRIVSDTYWDARLGQLNAQVAIEQSDENPYVFSTKEGEKNASRIASDIYPWKTLLFQVP